VWDRIHIHGDNQKISFRSMAKNVRAGHALVEEQVLGFSLIHTGALARWPDLVAQIGKPFKRFQTDAGSMSTRLKPRCE
jgi:hypothetical protein